MTLVFLPPKVSINNKGLVYSVVLLLASVFLTVRKPFSKMMLYKLKIINE